MLYRSLKCLLVVLLCFLAAPVIGADTAQAQSTKNAFERVVVVLHMNVKPMKKWDVRTKPDLSMCVGKKCWPRPRSFTGKPTVGKQIKKALCKNSEWCWVGCSNQQRVFISRSKDTTFEIYDVDKYSSNDRIAKIVCKRGNKQETTCKGKYASVTVAKYSKKLCKRLKSSKPKGSVH
jgi:hypothetical protein